VRAPADTGADAHKRTTWRSSGMSIEEGKTAPAFTLEDTQGKTVSLKDFKGKNVILYFYPKDDTPGCTKEACGFRDLWSEIQAENAVVLGVSPDGPAAHAKFVEKYALPFTLLCDPDKKVMEKYGAWGEKMMYGRKTVGVIRSTVWIGEDGKVRKHWARVPKAEAHPAKVLEVLRG
jgi:peroxiredoxin Q/BCP